MRQIQKYCKHRAEETPTTPNLAFIEFNIGQQISNLFQLRQKNYFPHTTRPSITYAYILAIIKKYHFTFEQLFKNNIASLYKIITLRNIPPDKQIEDKWFNVHHPFLPNYLKTFNYRCAWNIFPVLTKYHTYPLEAEAQCPMCLERPETLKHLLLECRFAHKIWTFTDKIIRKFTPNHITPDIKLQLAIPRELQLLKNLTFLITATRHAIWKTRNQTYYENRLTTPDQVIKSIIRSMKYKNTMESRKTISIYADTLQMLVAEIEKS